MLDAWEGRSPGRRQVMFNAVTNVRPSHVADPALFDFAALAGYCTLRSGNSLELGAMSPCWGAPQQGLPILVFHGVANQPWRRANGQTEGYGG